MKLHHTAALSATLVLAACGGGTDGPRAVPVTPAPVASAATITSVTPEGALRYGQTARFTVVGTNLTSGVTLTSAGCTGGAAAAGGTATQVTMTCTPVASGAVKIDFAPTNGSVQASIAPSVPVPQVRLATTKGDITVELYPNNTPITVANFVNYVQDGFYNGKIFHRVINNFVIQGGGFDANLNAGTPRADIKLEVNKGLSNTRGTIAMARREAPDSANAQFFINVKDNLDLDPSALSAGYAVFGKVIAGMDVVDAIKVVPTNAGDVPLTPVVITSATQIQ